MEQWKAEIMWVLLAMAGGIARYLDQYLRLGDNPRMGPLFGHAVVSGFCGYMVAHIAQKLSPDWTVVAAGAGGYLGTQGLDWLSALLRSKLAQTVGQPNPPLPPPAASPPEKKDGDQ